LANGAGRQEKYPKKRGRDESIKRKNGKISFGEIVLIPTRGGRQMKKGHMSLVKLGYRAKQRNQCTPKPKRDGVENSVVPRLSTYRGPSKRGATLKKKRG